MLSVLAIQTKKPYNSCRICHCFYFNCKFSNMLTNYFFGLSYRFCILFILTCYSGLLLATFKHGSSCSINTSDELQELLGRHGSKVLHSSKEALLVTKKQYLRKDWCRTEPLVHEVKEEGCAPASVLNNFCYGQCNSFFIPRGSRRKVRLTHF